MTWDFLGRSEDGGQDPKKAQEIEVLKGQKRSKHVTNNNPTQHDQWVDTIYIYIYIYVSTYGQLKPVDTCILHTR